MASGLSKGSRFCRPDKICFLCANCKSAHHCLFNSFSSLSSRLGSMAGMSIPRFIGNYFRPVSDHLLRHPIITKHSESYMLHWERYKSDYLKNAKATSWKNLNYMNHDLKRFLEEVGTDPKEARYWLKQFQRLSSIPSRPFAVVQVDQTIFQQPDLLENLSSNLAFLHRNDMTVIVVHGADFSKKDYYSEEELQALRFQVTNETMAMVNFLQATGAPAHPLFSGSNILQAEIRKDAPLGKVVHVNTEPLKWCLEGGHIPVISSIGETSSSQLINIDTIHATEEIARAMQPIKILLLNDNGGLRDVRGQVVPNVHFPTDMGTILGQTWHNSVTQNKLKSINKLLKDLPHQSSIVIASATCILTELFTHHGSGTLFKSTERIHKVQSIDELDSERLLELLAKAFNKTLRPDYITHIRDRVNTIYISEDYNAVAIVTNEDGVHGIPYLDKFAVSIKTQGEGTSDVLWEHLQADFPSLFWRSRITNHKINSWYFKRCEGSWSNNHYTVFWFGIVSPKLSYEVVDWAVKVKSSFYEPDDDVGSPSLQASEPW